MHGEDSPTSAQQGKTIVIVSHSLPLSATSATSWHSSSTGSSATSVSPADVIDEYLGDVFHDRVNDGEFGLHAWGSGEVRIERVELLDAAGEPTKRIRTGDAVTFRMHYATHQPVRQPVFGIAIQRIDGVEVTGPNTREAARVPRSTLEGNGIVDLRVDRLMLVPGTYDLTVALANFSLTHTYDSRRPRPAVRRRGGRSVRGVRRRRARRRLVGYPVHHVTVMHEQRRLTTERLRSRQRVLVATGDVLEPKMAGPAIRAWHIARALSREHEVHLVSTLACALTHPDFAVSYGDDRDISRLVDWCDVVVFQGNLMALHAALRTTDKVVVVDIYDPFHLEVLEQARDLEPRHRGLTIGDRDRRDQPAATTRGLLPLRVPTSSATSGSATSPPPDV